MSSKYIKYTLTPAEFFNGQWQNVGPRYSTAVTFCAINPSSLHTDKESTLYDETSTENVSLY